MLSSRLAKISKSPELQLLCGTGCATLLCTTQLEADTESRDSLSKMVLPQCHVQNHHSNVLILNSRPEMYGTREVNTDNLSEKPVQRFSSSVQETNSSLNPSFTKNVKVGVPVLTFFTVVSSKFWGADAEVIVVSYFADSTILTGICTTWI